MREQVVVGGCCCSFLCVDKAGQEGSIPVSNSKLHTPCQNHYRCIVLHQPLSLALVFIISPLLSHNPLGDEPNDLTTTADTHILLHTHTDTCTGRQKTLKIGRMAITLFLCLCLCMCSWLLSFIELQQKGQSRTDGHCQVRLFLM